MNNYETNTIKSYIKKQFENSEDIKITEKELIKEFSNLIVEIETQVTKEKQEKETREQTSKDFYNDIKAVFTNPKYKDIVKCSFQKDDNDFFSPFASLFEDILTFPFYKKQK